MLNGIRPAGDPEEIENQYREENARLLRARLSYILAVAFGVCAVACILEHYAHPHRGTAVAAAFVFGGVPLLLASWWLRRSGLSPRSFVVVPAVVVVLLLGILTAYEVAVGGEAEALALGHICILVGAMAFLPWGWEAQAVVGAASIALYVTGLAAGVAALAPVGHLVLGLLCIVGLTTGSTALLDRSRFGLFRQAREMRAANRDLERGNERLRESNEVKMQFLANVSHEFRTPLTVIIGFTQLARENAFGELPQEATSALGRVLTHSRLLFGLVNDFLDFSRLEAKRLTLHMGEVELETLFEEVRELIEPLVNDKPVRLVCDGGRGLVVHADLDRLRQVLINLLSNAAKFTDMGQIELRARRDGAGSVLIEVADTGLGIPAAEQESIFQPFQRGSESERVSGVGIGLALSRQLTEAMGGSLAVASESGRGSTFSVHLPAGASQDGDAQPSEAA